MKPLTIEELRNAKKEDFIWIEKIKQPKLSGYCNNVSFTNKMFSAMGFKGKWNCLRIEDYGKTWLAYQNKQEAERKGCEMCEDDIFDAYVPVSYEGDICEKPSGPGEEWVYHANYCPNCGRRLISVEAERRLLKNSKA